MKFSSYTMLVEYSGYEAAEKLHSKGETDADVQLAAAGRNLSQKNDPGHRARIIQ